MLTVNKCFSYIHQGLQNKLYDFWMKIDKKPYNLESTNLKSIVDKISCKDFTSDLSFNINSLIWRSVIIMPYRAMLYFDLQPLL